MQLYVICFTQYRPTRNQGIHAESYRTPIPYNIPTGLHIKSHALNQRLYDLQRVCTGKCYPASDSWHVSPSIHLQHSVWLACRLLSTRAYIVCQRNLSRLTHLWASGLWRYLVIENSLFLNASTHICAFIDAISFIHTNMLHWFLQRPSLADTSPWTRDPLVGGEGVRGITKEKSPRPLKQAFQSPRMPSAGF